VRLGRTTALVLSSPETSKEVMKDHDQDCSSRPPSVGPRRLSYNFLDVAFSPYADYWKEMRTLLVVELLSMKRVSMFWYARNEQMEELVAFLSTAYPNPVNLTRGVFEMTDGFIGTVAFGKNYGKLEFKTELGEVISGAFEMLNSFDAEDFFPIAGKFIDRLTGVGAQRERIFSTLDGYFERIIDQHLDHRPRPEHEDIVDILLGLMRKQQTSFQLSKDHLKALTFFLGAIATSVTTITWAFSELLRNPRIMKKAQSEIRGKLGPNRQRVEATDLDSLKYLECVIKETFRKHPPLPLLLPHYCTKQCKIGGYDVFPGTQLLINAYAIGRDPKHWDNPELFYPERFDNLETDYKGSHYVLVPFGAGRRICPGLAMGASGVKHALANLLYGFDYELPDGMKFEEFPMEDGGGLTVCNKHDIMVIPKKHEWASTYV
ncbi:hypothetical protein Tsubulata_017133, partial [Turnera subulata]